MEDSVDQTTTEALEGISTDGISTAVIASVGSVMLALYFYYVRGDKQRGQFVGLWPTSILALASYFKLEEIKQTLEEDGN
jgi:predicted PurR-regulated permease PerM